MWMILSVFLCVVQVQGPPLQQANKRQHLHRDRLREVPHLPGELWGSLGASDVPSTLGHP